MNAPSRSQSARASPDLRYAVFDTAMGPCGIAWSRKGVARLQLPEKSPAALTARMGALARPGTPPPSVRRAIQKVRRHLAGEPQDFSDVALDYDGATEFARSVYEQARSLATGETCSYGDLAAAMKRAGAARAVGRALSGNPVPVIVPCHRIVGSGGAPGGFSAFDGAGAKRFLLEREGVAFDARGRVVPRVATLWRAGALEQAVAHLVGADPILKKIIRRVGPCTLAAAHPGDPFGALCESVIYQQLAGKAAAAIAGRYRALSGDGRYPGARDLLDQDEAALRGAGLSGGKIATLRALAAAVVTGALPLDRLADMPDGAVGETLTRVRGIGPWTTQMLLIFHLGRRDVLPVGDLGVRKAAGLAYGLHHLPTPPELEAIAGPWRPYRTVGTWYLWRSLGTVTIS